MTASPDPIDIWWHDAMLLHDTGCGMWDHAPGELLDVPELHPENAVRLRNMRSVLQRGPLAGRVRWHDGVRADEALLATVHDARYVAEMRDFCASGGGRLDDGATVFGGEETWTAALLAAGSAVAATDAVLAGEAKTALALVRPPGHHAQPACADGYCMFNNAALAAQRARHAGVERVAVVDWDVHHGNGTQACFYDRADVLTISLHMAHGVWGPRHPQTGSPSEVGHANGQGYNINVELPLGSGDIAYETAMRDVVLPVLRQYRPGLIVGACGQDASAFDANGRQNVSMDGFRTIGDALRQAATDLTGGRLVLVQEGGYARTYAALCLHATLEGIVDAGADERLPEAMAYIPDDIGAARRAVERVQSSLGRHWRFITP